jgi:4a-hydroxytetrahydrobiopterin dehydratase
MAALDEIQIRERLTELPAWTFEGGAISKRYKFGSFANAIAFVDRVAEIAEAQDHHPDIAINFMQVTMSCTTHSAGRVTPKDFRLAEAIEIAYADAGAQE